MTIDISGNADLMSIKQNKSPGFNDSSFEGLLNQREKACVLVAEVLERLTALNTLKKSDPPNTWDSYDSLANDLLVEVRGHSENFAKYQEKIIRKIDQKFWRNALETTKLSSVLSSSKSDEIEEILARNPPEFNRENIYGTFTSLFENRLVYFIEGAVNVFKKLQRSYKTNDGICFRKKIIVTHSQSRSRIIDDLEKIFYLLDGVDPSTRGIENKASAVMDRSPESYPDRFVLPYFTVERYLNGNCHIKLTSKALTEKLNAIIAKHYGNVLGHRRAKR